MIEKASGGCAPRGEESNCFAIPPGREESGRPDSLFDMEVVRIVTEKSTENLARKKSFVIIECGTKRRAKGRLDIADAAEILSDGIS